MSRLFCGLAIGVGPQNGHGELDSAYKARARANEVDGPSLGHVLIPTRRWLVVKAALDLLELQPRESSYVAAVSRDPTPCGRRGSRRERLTKASVAKPRNSEGKTVFPPTTLPLNRQPASFLCIPLGICVVGFTIIWFCFWIRIRIRYHVQFWSKAQPENRSRSSKDQGRESASSKETPATPL